METLLNIILMIVLFTVVFGIPGALLVMLMGRAIEGKPVDMTGWTHEQRMEYHAAQQAQSTRAIGGMIIWNTIRNTGAQHDHTDQSAG